MGLSLQFQLSTLRLAGVEASSSSRPSLPSPFSSLVGTIATAINRPSDAAGGGRARRARAAMGAIWRTHFRLGAVRAGELPLLWLARKEGRRRRGLSSPRDAQRRTGSRFDAEVPSLPACLKSICSSRSFHLCRGNSHYNCNPNGNWAIPYSFLAIRLEPALHSVFFIMDTVKLRLGLVPYKPLSVSKP